MAKISLPEPRMEKRGESPDARRASLGAHAAWAYAAEAEGDLFERHVVEPQHRLTRGLALRRGERVVDLACGAGAETVRMLKEVAPGEIVAVDRGEAKLRVTVARAAQGGLAITPLCARPEDVVENAREESFDVAALRFALGELDWRVLLPRVSPILRRGGRFGIVTSLSTSAPQAYAVYLAMTEDLGIRAVQPTVPRRASDIEEALVGGGFAIVETWTQPLRLRFAGGDEAVRWLLRSGYVAHPMLASFTSDAIAPMARDFGERLDDEFGDDDGVPLDFDIAGVVAAKY